MDQRDPDRLHSLHLFAGAGGSLLTDLLLGHRPVCAVELDPYCQQVLVQRQRDGVLPWFPVWDDARTFDGQPWRGVVDVVSGGFPCQDISVAGRGAGIHGARSGLWTEFARILGEVRPQYAFIENVPALTVRGLPVVLADLAALGMDARWCCLGADDVGAPHHRKRLWILAESPEHGRRLDPCRPDVTDPSGFLRAPESLARAQRRGGCRNLREAVFWPTPTAQDATNHAGASQRHRHTVPLNAQVGGALNPTWVCWLMGWPLDWTAPSPLPALTLHPWTSEPPDVPRVTVRVPHRAAQLKALGNGWVPACAAHAWQMLTSPAA